MRPNHAHQSEVPRVQSWGVAASVAARHAPRMHTEDRLKSRVQVTDAQKLTAKRLAAEGFGAVYIAKAVGCPDASAIERVIS